MIEIFVGNLSPNSPPQRNVSHESIAEHCMGPEERARQLKGRLRRLVSAATIAPLKVLAEEVPAAANLYQAASLLHPGIPDENPELKGLLLVIARKYDTELHIANLEADAQAERDELAAMATHDILGQRVTWESIPDLADLR